MTRGQIFIYFYFLPKNAFRCACLLIFHDNNLLYKVIFKYTYEKDFFFYITKKKYKEVTF